MKKMPVLLDLFWTFAKMGAVTFGGGLAMMPIMQRELIEKKHWMTEDEMLDYFAVGQSTPGVIAVNVSTFVGYKEAGVIGGIIGTFGIVTPSLIIIMLIARFISSVDQYPLAQKALKGINVAVAALLTYVTITFTKKTVKKIVSLLFMAAAFIFIYFFNVQTYWIILGAAAVGIVIYEVGQKKKHGIKTENRASDEKNG